MTRVLNVTECLQSAGIESYIMNVYRNIDRNSVQFDFLVTRNQKEFYDDEIKCLGGKKFIIDRMKIKSTFLRVIFESIEMYKFLKKEDYSIIQIHSGTPLRVFYLIAAKAAKVPKRIYHSHSAEVFGPHKGLYIKKKIFKLIRKLIPLYATDMLACSKAAARWMYPSEVQDRVKVINNGIILDKFIYDEKIRNEYRKKFNVENKKVIGHVARFNHQKNHTFLIDIVAEVVKKDSNYILWLIGNGELQQEIKEKVKQLNLEDNVKFLGVRDDVNKLMQAMDIFVLPSNYEGLPVVGIEAQTSGLKCLFSDKITDEVIITDKCKVIELNKEKWITELLDFNINEENKRNYEKEIKNAGYDIEKTVQDLYMLYLK